MAAVLQDSVRRQAECRPDAVALVCRDDRMTYGELETASNRLARLLKCLGCQKGDRIALLMPKSLEAIVGILGILKADAVYVPLDPASPAARVEKILHSCGVNWMLAAAATTPLLDELFASQTWRDSLRVGCLGKEKLEGRNFRALFAKREVEALPDEPRDSHTRRDDPAHILFTSGSTGNPKGVVITHANVAHFVRWANEYFDSTPDDRLSGHPPLHFDLSTYDIFGSFAAGAQLHLVPPELSLLPHKLAELIRTSALTRWFSVPSLLTYMAKFDVVEFNDFPSLRHLLWCGEVFPTPALTYWMKRLPHVKFTNLYGPTEATIASSYFTLPSCPDDDKAEIPIGVPCGGEELLVLDDHLQPAAAGEVGDLYIAGVGLSPGYWKNPEATAQAFFPDPRNGNPDRRIYKTGDLARRGEDGLFYFVGRADSQIKSRGYRIELGEIESALNTLGCVRESAVVAYSTNGFEGMTLGCAYSPVPGLSVTPATLRQQLSRLLPAYMLPSRWIELGLLPRNPNGKIDRRRLKEELQHHEAQTHRALPV